MILRYGNRALKRFSITHLPEDNKYLALGSYFPYWARGRQHQSITARPLSPDTALGSFLTEMGITNQK